MKNNPLKQLGTLGQSIWLDYIRRDLIASGELRRLIEEDGLRGMTSNPAIFEKAIAESHDYDEDIRAMALEGKDAKAIYEALSQRDVQSAADEFRPLYDRTDGKDGYVSLEVNPHLAHDTHRHDGGSPPVVGRAEPAQRLHQGPGHGRRAARHPATHQRRNQRQRDVALWVASLPAGGGSLHRRHRSARGPRKAREACGLGGQLLCEPH